ncbi:MAG: L-seryl-tRNA(Sec) selenium transferase [Dehalococcoidales bacterium]|nr:L-seryl-tRNA(Sec) selenium transferase [Dehalococcoidales bacterium]
MNIEFRKLPSVEEILSDERIERLIVVGYPRPMVANLVRKELESIRRQITNGEKCPELPDIVTAVVIHAEDVVGCSLRPVINATGVILHTNLGRAPLSDEAMAAMHAVSMGYSNLEFDLPTGARGSRQTHIESLLCEITGAEAAMVVNNNAAAVLLGLSATAKRKEIIVSRGQSVEIGDSFRIPDVMRQSGAKLIEVGTTNCTYAADYENAITPSTVGLLRVHSSNFKVVGFTHEVSIEEMVAVGKKHNLPVFDDQGSGCLLDTKLYGLSEEPMVQKSIDAGVSLVFFSGDKLVGGPQAGIIVGKKEYIARLRKHPLARAVRIDKIRLAALIITLLHYVKGEAAYRIPVWRMISATLPDIDHRAQVWNTGTNGLGEIIDGRSMVGGGSLPGGTLPTRLVAFKGETGKKGAAFVLKLQQTLRNYQVPIVGRIENDVFLLDPRSVLPEDDENIKNILYEVTGKLLNLF